MSHHSPFVRTQLVVVATRCLAVLALLMSMLGSASVAFPADGSVLAAGAAGVQSGPAVLVGLAAGAGLRIGASVSAEGSHAAQLTKTLAALGVHSSRPVFAGTDQTTAITASAGPVRLADIHRLQLPPGANLLAVLDTLRATPGVLYAEPDYVARELAVPNDPLYGQQWGLPQIGAPAAWDVGTGGAAVVIAVVDAGLDLTHPDLAGQLWTNPGEVAGNGLDDDNNGYADDINGWNFPGNDDDLSDNTGHGTQVAGIIGAAGNNGTGVAGVCWGCRLMVVKVTQPGGIANYSDIAAGLLYAAQKGAKVINISLGGASDSMTLRAAIQVASATAVVVGGAGNDNSSAAVYPAAYPEVLAVAGTTMADTKTATSNFGAWVDVLAPGEAITTTFSGGTYGGSSGTSLAAPFAAGLAGLLRSLHPAWSPALARAQIIQTAVNVDGLNPAFTGQLGSGRINAADTVVAAPQPRLAVDGFAVGDTATGVLKVGAANLLAVSLVNDWLDAADVSANLANGNSNAAVSDSSGAWGAIAAGQVVSNTGNLFEIAVTAGAYGQPVPLTLTLNADGFNQTLYFTPTTESVVQTISGVIASDTTWTNDRVYHATGNVIVNTGVTLTVEAGTTVKFDANRALLINGTLIAIGTETTPIVFTSAAVSPAPGDWGSNVTCMGQAGLILSATSQPAIFDSDGSYLSGTILRHVIVEYGEGIASSSGLYLDYVTVRQASQGVAHGGCGVPQTAVITHSRIEDSTGVGLWLGFTVSLRQNLIANNAGGAMYMYDVGGEIISNTIVGNGGFECYLPSLVRVALCPGHDVGMSFSGNTLLDNQADHVLAMFSGNTFTATQNYWGTTDTAVIDQMIYDTADDLSFGNVLYSPFLTAADPDAPAILTEVVLTPQSPVGIQEVAFELNFSTPMDHSQNPQVSFRGAPPDDENNYVVSDNAQWLDDNTWRATYDITSLLPRGPYHLTVSNARGLDGLTMWPDQNFTFAVDYAIQITDQSPPLAPTVMATGTDGVPGELAASWQATDAESTVVAYRYAVGSAPGAVDIINWTITTSTGVARSGLGLTNGQTYYVSVQAQNSGGLWSPVVAAAFTAGMKTVYGVLLPLLMR